MFAPPPKLINITIYSLNADVMFDFYEELGMLFSDHRNRERSRGKYIYNDLAFEIIKVDNKEKQTRNLKLKFFIDEIKGYLEYLEKYDSEIIKAFWETENSEHIIISDPDGNHVELESKKTSLINMNNNYE